MTLQPSVPMKDFYTYAYLREDGSPYYVGKGKGDRAFSTQRRNKPLCNSKIVFLRKNMSEKDALKHECKIIKFFGRKDLGTGILRNRTDGGEGISGHKFSDESRARISLANKGKKRSEEHKSKMSIARLGMKKSEETRAKMSLASIGKKMSNEAKAKMSLSRLVRRCTDETKAKLSLARKGKKLSEEHKAKIGLSQIARRLAESSKAGKK